MKTMMDDRSRFVNTVLGKTVDRPPFYLYWGPWGSTWRRWEREWTQSSQTGFHDFRRSWDKVRHYFGLDMPPRVVPVKCGPCPEFERRVIEETAEKITRVDSWGIVRRDFKGHESMSEFLSFPVQSRDDWEKFRRERLDPTHPGRLAGRWREMCAQWQASGYPILLGWYPDVGLYGCLRWLLGDEACLTAFCEDPELVHDIMGHLTNLWLTIFGVVCREVPIDVVHLWEDMSGRQGPFIGPDMFREFMAPHYRKIREFADANNIPVMSVDTDGDPTLLVPEYIASGVNMLLPLEVAAGCDVNRFRADFPELSVLGGIDKRALAETTGAIDTELSRVRSALDTGRYFPELDHLIPDDVSWDNFMYFVENVKKMIGMK